MWRTDPLYLALRDSNSHFENAHYLWRTRYNVGPDSCRDRPKRRGIACQQLRATAALLVEWLLICTRESWRGSLRRPDRVKARVNQDRFIHDQGVEKAESFAKFRQKIGLLAPYGPKAKTLGVGDLHPSPGLIETLRPGRRTSKAPPDEPDDADLPF